ncbi:hypothetical protein PV367_01060 [Streptomyces europaeiscabiei]|uniref:Uncharacterized protein n=1 Tax=Streptomyces europaeiscabiei TaxID=146819 RepID=A0AAJ2PK16_9ACTN|nr:hypothetical protein [Streptomyces europaeiscabiei]
MERSTAAPPGSPSAPLARKFPGDQCRGQPRLRPQYSLGIRDAYRPSDGEPPLLDRLTNAHQLLGTGTLILWTFPHRDPNSAVRH